MCFNCVNALLVQSTDYVEQCSSDIFILQNRKLHNDLLIIILQFAKNTFDGFFIETKLNQRVSKYNFKLLESNSQYGQFKGFCVQSTFATFFK